MYFEIRETDGIARIGKFTVRNKIVDTPTLFPVVSPFINDIKPKELIADFGAQCCFTNAYLVYKSNDFKEQYLSKGVHSMLDFDGVIATDSGAFQHFMYGGDLNIEPSEIEEFQEKINSDCPVILDIPVQFTDPYDEAKRKVEITISRAKENLKRRNDPERAWYGPIHGSIYPDLLRKSCEEMSKLDYGIYAIGGVVKSFIDYRFDVDVQIMLNVKQWLNPSKPLHLFGLGLPSFFAMAVACGADFFDSAAYILFAKEGRYFTFSGTKHISDLLELPCCCPVCSRFSAKELNELPEKEKTMQIARHNLYLSYMELKNIKQAIREGTLWELVEQRSTAHPKFLKALKTIRQYQPFLESMEPRYKTKGIKYLTEYSLYNPTLTKQRRYIAEKHQEYADTLIFIPELDEPSYTNKTVKDTIDKIIQKIKSKTGSTIDPPDAPREDLGKYSLSSLSSDDKELENTEFLPFSQIRSKMAYSLYIVSDIVGLIPYTMADVYPNSQHEGNPDIYPGCSLVREHLTAIATFFERIAKKSQDAKKRVLIYYPVQYINEFGENESFLPSNHLIGHISLLAHDFPTMEIRTSIDLDELLKSL